MNQYCYGDRGSTVVKVLCYKSEGRWFNPSWFDCRTVTFTVHTARVPAPHNHRHHSQRRTPYAAVHPLVLLMMGIMMPETCSDKSLIINIRLIASCWFLSLHPSLIHIAWHVHMCKCTCAHPTNFTSSLSVCKLANARQPVYLLSFLVA